MTRSLPTSRRGRFIAPVAAARRSTDAARDLVRRPYDAAVARWPETELLTEVFHRWRRLNGALLAGNLTYRLFLWALPLLLVVVAALGFEGDGPVASAAGGWVGLGRDLARGIGQAARQAHTSAIYALAVGLLGLLMASRSLIIALHFTFAQVWELPVTARRGTAAAVAKFVSSLPLGVAILVITIVVRKIGIIGGVSSQVITFLFGVGVLLAADWVLPRRTERWSDLVPGALLGGVALVVARHTALYYFENHAARASRLYGTLGVVAGVLSALFLLSAVVVGNAVVNTVWFDRIRGGAEPETEG